MTAREAIDAAARLRLEGVVGEATRGGGELVVAVVPACDADEGLGWRLGAVLAATAFLGLALFAPPLPAWGYLGAQALAVAAARTLARLPAVRRRLIPDSRLERRVAARARRAFAESGLDRAPGGRGVLLLASLCERRVAVLAGEGVACDAAEWRAVVELATDGLRRGRAVEGLEAAARRCGEILSRQGPVDGAARPALPATVILEDAADR